MILSLTAQSPLTDFIAKYLHGLSCNARSLVCAKVQQGLQNAQFLVILPRIATPCLIRVISLPCLIFFHFLPALHVQSPRDS